MSIDIDALQQSYKQLNDIVGTKNMLKIYNEFRGTQLNLPMKLYDREGTIRAIQQEYPRMSTRELSDKYGFSQRWVTSVINKKKDKNI